MSVAQQDVVHDVLFAESDDELTDVVGDRLAEVLLTGGSAVVIATPDHGRRLTDHLRAASLDPDDRQADGTLLLLDAEETLRRLTPGGALDVAVFDEVLGRVVRDRIKRGPVFAFGEMVALLFDDDRPEEALELEAAWDELLHATSAQLLCVYPGVLLDDPDQARHVGAVCSIHSAVVADSAFRRAWTLPDEETAKPTARRLAANALRARGVPEDAFYDTLSVVTELVANAVAQGGTPVSVEMTVDDALVSVRVGDGSPAAPALRSPGRRKARRRLHVVEELARHWGVETTAEGKVVWAELAR